jgi:hypothetical protein
LRWIALLNLSLPLKPDDLPKMESGTLHVLSVPFPPEIDRFKLALWWIEFTL